MEPLPEKLESEPAVPLPLDVNFSDAPDALSSSPYSAPKPALRSALRARLVKLSSVAQSLIWMRTVITSPAVRAR